MKIYNWLLCCLPVLMAVCACDRMNDLHDKYLEKGEIIYTMKVDSAIALAGNGRVLLRYYTTDPKARKLLACWNLGTDSVVFDIPAKNAIDSVDVYVAPLEEGPVYFQLFTMNENMQNKSVPFDVYGNVYGSVFQRSLMNRNCAVTRNIIEQKVTVTWYSAADRVAGCEIKYKNRLGETVSRTAPVDETVTVIEDMSNEAEYIEYRTAYLPEPDAIDVFYSDYTQAVIKEEDANITDMVLVNTKYPFISGAQVVGAYYEAVGWTVSPNIAPNGNVSYDNLTMITWPGDGPVTSATNAKLYQTVELEAGKYRFSVFGYGTWGNSVVYIAIAPGNELPDTDDTERDALAYAILPMIANWSSDVIDLEFTLSAKRTVSIGFVGNFNPNTQIAFREKFELWKLGN